jgi:hypothetical protein
LISDACTPSTLFELLPRLDIVAAAVFMPHFHQLSGTLFSMASMLNHRIPGFVDEKTKAFPNQVRV